MPNEKFQNGGWFFGILLRKFTLCCEDMGLSKFCKGIIMYAEWTKENKICQRACFRTTYLPVRISLVFICPWPEHYISWHRISGWQTLFHSKLSHKILRIKMRVRWEDLWWRRTSAQASLPWKRYCVKFFHIYMRICSPLPGLTRMRTWSPL